MALDRHRGADGRAFAIVQARRRLRELKRQLQRTAQAPTAEAVHRTRVAIRRFTRAIAASQPFLRTKDVRKSRQRLKEIMAAAGMVRDCDVALRFLARLREPRATGLQARLKDRRDESASALSAALTGFSNRQTSLKWVPASAGDPAALHPPLQEFARRSIGRIWKEFLTKGDRARNKEATARNLHRFRIACKKLRYTLEFFRPLYGPAFTEGVAGIKRVSALLGDINDCVTVEALLANYRHANRLIGRLKRRQRKKTDLFREQWKRDFADGAELRTAIDRLVRPAIRKPAAKSTQAYSPRSAKIAAAAAAFAAGEGQPEPARRWRR